MMGYVARFLGAGLFLLLAAAPLRAMEIERVVSASGIEAWLVEERAVPVIAVEVGFHGGQHVEPAARAGLARMMAALLDEGAGPLDSDAFKTALEERAIGLGFEAGRDGTYATLTTLSAHRDEAFRLLSLALTVPRFDAAPVERVRGQLLSRLKRDADDPDRIAMDRWFAEAFPGHPYGRPLGGTPEGLAAITSEDLKAHFAATIARDRMKIAVVGDIDARTLARLLERSFAGLPAQGAADETATVAPRATGEVIVVRRPIPQSVVIFGGPGLKRADPDFIPAFVLNYILGGGGFASRLTEEVREKRGLAYSVYSYLLPLDHAGVVLGGVATENARVRQSLDLIRGEMASILAAGVTPEELQNAKTYLTGSYPLRFDTNAKIAGELVSIQLENLGIDYIDRRNALIDAVTRDDLMRVAPRILDPEGMLVTVVGAPDRL